MSSARVLIAGVGNPLRGDDAAGLVAAERLRALCPQARVLECRGDAAMLLDAFAGADSVLLIDAARSGATPGTVRRIDATHEPLPADLRNCSTHGFGAAEAVETARALGSLPARVIVYAIEGRAFELGAEVSDDARRGIDEAVRLAAADTEADGA